MYVVPIILSLPRDVEGYPKLLVALLAATYLLIGLILLTGVAISLYRAWWLP